MPSATNYGAEEFSQKQVPYSLEAEQAVLGTVLRDPSKLTEVLGKLPPDAFYIPRHRQIYRTSVTAVLIYAPGSSTFTGSAASTSPAAHTSSFAIDRI